MIFALVYTQQYLCMIEELLVIFATKLLNIYYISVSIANIQFYYGIE
jgi:hypothetical protein